ncbi:HPr kinase/phosphorylase [Sneathiella glossodoripedis]|uniref:HPr kinase/phosphorylase n=1 Tax=Sneathiella glossodoripedis TaxID=418853 RepID=UPI00046E9550|nr:HPr kinase/phosphatase C-terminal domain-containing protein [Sneathiella glossodoripedis]
MKKIHASAVAIQNQAILLRGPSGAGKSDLALRLIGEGATLICDDYVELEILGGQVWAHTPKNIAGLIEVRGLGIVSQPYVSGVSVALVCDLVQVSEIERLPDPPQYEQLLNIAVPRMDVDYRAASTPARIRLALDRRSEIWPSELGADF